MLLGAGIGLERQWRNSAAGLRTNTLVCAGAAMFVLVAPLSGSNDLSHIAAQIVSGIGFIGGGAILRDGLTIRGVNTAATLWCSAAVGALCGAGLLAEAGAASAVILAANLLLRPISHHMATQDRKLLSGGETHYLLRFHCESKDEMRLRKLLINTVEGADLVLQSIRSQSIEPAGAIVLKAVVVSPKKNDHLVEKVVSTLGCDPEVNEVSWEIVEQRTDRE